MIAYVQPMTTPTDEATRADRLLEAQGLARRLFAAIEETGIIRPGVSERQASDEVRDLAANLLGVDRHWHKRVIRAGRNSLEPFHSKPPERVIEADDIVYADLGPIFGEWEADFGRTYVLGDDPDKLRLRDTLPVVFDAGHLVGEFPHELAAGDDVYSRIMPGNDRPMRGVDRAGSVCHWILEVHLVDRGREIGGFYEELLDL